MILKNLALSPSGYVRDSMNIFDGTIVSFSLIDLGKIIMQVFTNIVNLKAFRSLRILRALRVLRVTKLLRSLAFMKVIIKVLQGSIVNFLNIRNILNSSCTYDYI